MYSEGVDHQKRKAIAFGFIISVSIFSVIDRFFIKLSDQMTLLALVLMIISFSLYMFVVIIGDKKQKSIT